MTESAQLDEAQANGQHHARAEQGDDDEGDGLVAHRNTGAPDQVAEHGDDLFELFDHVFLRGSRQPRVASRAPNASTVWVGAPWQRLCGPSQ